MKKLSIFIAAAMLTGCTTNLIYANKEVHMCGSDRNEIGIVGSEVKDAAKGNKQEGGDVKLPVTGK